ncbi:MULTISPECIES: DUF3325 domain-containing protein [Pseudomonas]|uniref:DUF3325 domain-containing protein n=1 Tax=Pseudomonas TaxID=286 RepID=UPI000CFDCEA4|nr:MULTISPECIES: DUF3325 domain-containing protein [Pseudomonas]PQZ89373.1 iron uptake protein [Pseudomonas trivialis]PRB25095.1 iron uptake protein [Pseudomonas sp. MYb60]
MNLTLIASLLLAYCGMLGLCFGLERHYKHLGYRLPAKGLLRVWRSAGWLALAASLSGCVLAWGWAMGPVGWLGLLSLAGLALVFVLPYAPRAGLWIGGLSWPLLGILACL